MPGVVDERLGAGVEGRKIGLLLGIENGSLPVASTRPSRTSARPWPPSIPEYHDWAMAGTEPSHSEITTALPATTATTERGLAAATALIRATS